MEGVVRARLQIVHWLPDVRDVFFLLTEECVIEIKHLFK